MNREQLESAYEATIYRLVDENINFDLHVGPTPNDFKQWCKKKNVITWAIITAFNPFSASSSDKANEKSNERLLQVLLSEKLEYFDAMGISTSSDWPPEISFFICNITKQKAVKLGQLFRQNAIVFGNKDKLAVIWINAS